MFLNWILRAHPSWSFFPKWCFDQAQWYFPFYLTTAVNRSSNSGESLILQTHPHSFTNIQNSTCGIIQLLTWGPCCHRIPALCGLLWFDVMHCLSLDKQYILLILLAKNITDEIIYYNKYPGAWKPSFTTSCEIYQQMATCSTGFGRHPYFHFRGRSVLRTAAG